MVSSIPYEAFDPTTTVLNNTYIPTKNGEVFFREDNRTAWDWAVRLAPQQVAEHSTDAGNPLCVLDAGCSRGRQTWALASLLATKGIDFVADAADVNPEVLKEVDEPYDDTLDKIKQSLEKQDLPLGCLDYFETLDKTHVRPVEELRRHVRFSQMDFRTQSFAPNAHHAVMLTNVMGHYYYNEEERRMGITVALNAGRSLVPRGILSINSSRELPRQFAWHGFTEDPELDPDFVALNFRYNPLTRGQKIRFGLQKLIFK